MNFKSQRTRIQRSLAHGVYVIQFDNQQVLIVINRSGVVSENMLVY